MVCPACGTDFAVSDGLCPECGRPVSPSAATTAPVPGEGGPDETVPMTHVSNRPASSDRIDASEAVTRVPSAADPRTPGSRSHRGLLTPGQMFGPRYLITRLLGEGGMGAVYEAEDREIGIPVALKVIRPEITADPAAAREIERRFKRELLLARQVTHTNVVRIHDLGDIDRIKYISMSYIDGGDLATVLRRDGTLTPAAALPIIRSIAAGLAAAHQAGVVHRDLKPGNVMIDARGEALIMDFGIARSAAIAEGETAAFPSSAASVGKLGQTTTGTIVGTIPYMAPEQAFGGVADHRADIYALGLIAYDMLTVRRREAYAADRMGELKEREKTAPPPIGAAAPAVPAPLAGIIMRCIQPSPGDRYQSTRDLIAALDRLDAQGKLLPVVRRVTRRQLSVSAAAVAALLLGTWWLAQPPPPRVEPAPLSVLIADFENGTSDPAFRDTLEQAAAVALEGAAFITSYNRYSARQLVTRASLGPALNGEAARLLALREGIDIVLAGSIASDPPGYAVALEAIDPSNGMVVARGQGSADDRSQVLQAVAAAASAIRGALGDTTPQSARLTQAETFTSTSFDAVQAYVRGQVLNAAGKPIDAVRAWEDAVRIDPRFGRAYANMALVYSNLKQEEAASRNYDLALKNIDRMTEREKYRSLGVYYLGATKNYEQAIQNFEALVKAYPADNMGYANLGLAYVYVRDLQNAMVNGRKAVEIYPRNLLQRTNYATYAMYAGDFTTAAAEAGRVLQENPAYEWAGQTLALSTLASGDASGAREAYGRLGMMSRLGSSLARMGEADLEMMHGRYPQAVNTLRASVAADEKEPDLGNSVALALVALADAYLATGQRAGAAAAARRAAALEATGAVYLPESVLFPAAAVLVRLGDRAGAQALAERLGASIPSPPRSYALLIEGEIALDEGRLPQAIDRFTAAQKLHDSWLAHFLLGTAYARANQFPEALAEWELCLKRRGEATDVFIADTATLRYLPPVHYWLARSLEAVGAVDGARANYEQYVGLRAAAPADPLVTDARQRLRRLGTLPATAN